LISFKVDPAFLVEAGRIRWIKRGDNAAGNAVVHEKPSKGFSSRPLAMPAGTTRLVSCFSEVKNDPENRRDDKRDQPPPAGPHDKPKLTEPAKTPGSGILPEQDAPAVDGPTG
jgi:hypothetical protein